MHRGQLNCALDWQLFTGMKKPLRTVATCHPCARQVVLGGGLTPAGFRFETLVTEQPALPAVFPEPRGKQRPSQCRVSRVQCCGWYCQFEGIA